MPEPIYSGDVQVGERLHVIEVAADVPPEGFEETTGPPEVVGGVAGLSDGSDATYVRMWKTVGERVGHPARLKIEKASNEVTLDNLTGLTMHVRVKNTNENVPDPPDYIWGAHEWIPGVWSSVWTGRHSGELFDPLTTPPSDVIVTHDWSLEPPYNGSTDFAYFMAPYLSAGASSSQGILFDAQNGGGLSPIEYGAETYLYELWLDVYYAGASTGFPPVPPVVLWPRRIDDDTVLWPPHNPMQQ